MKTKNLILFSAFIFSLVICLSLVMGAITHNTPLTVGDTVTGSYTFNITTALPNASNCSWATTDDSVFNITTNWTAGQTEFNVTIDTATELTDAEDTTLTVLCTNYSADTESGTLVINADNSNPTCSFLIDTTITERQSGLGISVTDDSSDTTDLTYNYTLWNEVNVARVSSSDASPSFSNGDLEDLGSSNITLILTDEASLTSTCDQEFLVTGSDGDEAPIIAGGALLLQNNNVVLGIIIVVIVIVIIAVGGGFMFVLNKIKKRR